MDGGLKNPPSIFIHRHRQKYGMIICGIRMYRSVTVVGDGDLRSGWNIDSVVL